MSRTPAEGERKDALSEQEREILSAERLQMLEQLEDWLETPMLLLGFAWLVLLVVEFTWGLSPLLQTAGTVIWGIFVLDFVIRLVLAPNKMAYLRRNWLTTIALLLPALRVYRLVSVLRLARVARGARLVRIVSSLNRGMRSLRKSMRRHGFGYVMALTLIVTLVGAAGIYAIEGALPNSRIVSYGEAVWWTAMIMTTIGPPTAPVTAEGRILFLLLALYAFGVFGYVTATLASYLIGQDAANAEAAAAGEQSIRELHEEIAALRAEIRLLTKSARSE